jgi:hypothetical protein
MDRREERVLMALRFVGEDLFFTTTGCCRCTLI